ncbi:transposable element Tcb1 transposase [Trichonephila clavipes]|nr:transposable element Tcb1 transposase [Trichonephila clavipes]
MKTRLRAPAADQSSRRLPHCKKCTRTANCLIGRYPGTGSAFTRSHVSSRTIRRCLAEGHLGSWHPLRVLPLTPEAADEFRFNLSSIDNRIRVWRPRGECINPVFALQRHTTPTAGVMVWGVIAYNTRSHLVLVYATMTASRYVHDILHFSTRQCSATHGKGVTRLSPHCHYPSLAV